jgi:hypothetical protein
LLPSNVTKIVTLQALKVPAAIIIAQDMDRRTRLVDLPVAATDDDRGSTRGNPFELSYPAIVPMPLTGPSLALQARQLEKIRGNG